MRFFHIFVVLQLLLASDFVVAKEVLLDRIVAIVDGYPVLYSSVMQKVKVGPLVTVSDFPAEEDASPFEKALQDSINFELVMSKARELEIEVPESQVDAEIDRFIQNNGQTKSGLMDFLARQGTSYDDYRSDFRDLMVLRRFQGRVITPMVKITDKDLITYYLKKSGTSAELVEITLRQILISVDDSAAPEIVEAKQKMAQEVLKKLKDGMDFKAAVNIYSDDEGKSKNQGLMMSMKLKDLAGEIKTAVSGLSKGEYSSAVRTSQGFHIFFLDDKEFGGSDDFLSNKNNLERELRGMELAAQTKKWLEQERQRTKVILVTDNSES